MQKGKVLSLNESVRGDRLLAIIRMTVSISWRKCSQREDLLITGKESRPMPKIIITDSISLFFKLQSAFR